MIIKKDPAAAAKRDIADILRNHEWLFLVNAGAYEGDSYILYDLLADLVYDIRQGKTFGRGAIN